MFNKHDTSRDMCQLFGSQARLGYDWWWHSFTGYDSVTGESRSFFIEFFVCNPDLAEDEPVLGQDPANRAAGKRPSYLMVKAGSWGKDSTQLHRFFGWNKVKLDFGCPFSVSADDCCLDERMTMGEISITKEQAEAHPEWMCSYGHMAWNLRIDKKVAFNVGYGASGIMRKLQLFEMFWHAEGMKTAYSGEVIYNGRTYIVRPEDCYGYADKNWGKDFTTPWVWLSSCNLTSEITGKRLTDSVFDIGGGRPKVGPVVLDRKLLSAFWHEGRGYEFNFSKFWTFCRTEFDCYETDTHIVWHVDQKTLGSRMITDITCPKADMLLVSYESPDGQKRHRRLFNGGTGEGTIQLFHHGKLVDRVHAENVGCEYGEYDTDQPYTRRNNS